MASKFRKTYTYINSDGEEQTVVLNGKSQKETDKQFQRLIVGKPRKATPTVREFVEKTFREAFIAPLKPTTRTNYELYLNLNILPFMGDMRMDEVTVATIQQFQIWMATASCRGRKNNLNAKTIERVCGLVGRIFKVAADMDIIEKSPYRKSLLRNPGEKAGHHKPLPDEEIIRIKREIMHLAGDRERLYMGLLAFTGIRREELLGLRWEDLNVEAGYGEVVRAVTYPGSKSAPHIDSAKSVSSARTILLPKALQDILKPLEQPEGFVLGGERPLCYSTAQRIQRRAFDQLGIKGAFNNHDFRTTFGTQLKENGLSSAIVADLMGHADTRMVETTYARTRQEGIFKQRSAVEAISAGGC